MVDPPIQVFRGIGEDVPDVRGGSHAGSLKGSILAKLSLGSRDSSNKKVNIDQRSLLSNEDELVMDDEYEEGPERIELRM